MMGLVGEQWPRAAAEGPGVGLRERKKAKTRAAIQQEALRLFRERGYEATTMEQIAEAAEVSQSTVFRYFPTKDELVVSDEQDAFFLQAWRAQPADLPVLSALRRAIQETLTSLSPGEFRAQRDRDVLMVTVPGLWAASLGNINQTTQMITSLVAERSGRVESAPSVRALSAAIFGVILSAMIRWAGDPDYDVARDLDQMLAHLDGDLRAGSVPD
ncbi:TetR family transcriptional regulator [Frankia sp. AgPm24]|uniref:TetR/AcrR family transcriptional regulator n=1 Tax=Frankia sp. AgPm24 TaxID=631128 RepID=UPI00200C00A6|nr:TetR family transcriptional regulator [Frankia sp. AgPm24]MCK9921349.1 TetR family transcriptional regulator [Frankia sp. AgPm24]